MVCILGCAYGGFISPSGLHRGYIYIFKKRKGGRGGSDLARIEAPCAPLTHWQCSDYWHFPLVIVSLLCPGAHLGAPLDLKLCWPGFRLDSDISESFPVRVCVGQGYLSGPAYPGLMPHTLTLRPFHP